jgi:hypothetical protein
VDLVLRLAGWRVTLLSIEPDEDEDEGNGPGPGPSADLSIAPGFVPPTPWYDDED